MKFRLIIVAALITTISIVKEANAQLKSGTWRGALQTSAGIALPFNFIVTDTAGKQEIAIINGDERFKVTDIKAVADSVFIHMPLFDSEFKLRLAGDSLAGSWIKHGATKDAVMPFVAKPNTTWRFFENPEQPAFNVSGRWAATFGDGDDKEQLVGEFKQKGARLTGTFLSTTGDCRFLEGTVAGNKFYLSCFDGGHAYIFTATLTNANTLAEGKQYSGFSGLGGWHAKKDANAMLPDAYSLTALKPGFTKIDFKFKDIDGKPVSLSDARFKNKVVIVQILGSWCPNCMDETNYFTSGYYAKYHPKGVEIIGLSYERTTDFARSQRTLQQLKTHFNVPYPLLITGFTPGNGDPEKSLPMLADFKGFPTTIIIDKKGEVRKIHTGFSGPGTGSYYKDFTDEFEKLTEDLLGEE
jgi:thiol-disulfide isomerase/thioredoxin